MLSLLAKGRMATVAACSPVSEASALRRARARSSLGSRAAPGGPGAGLCRDPHLLLAAARPPLLLGQSAKLAGGSRASCGRASLGFVLALLGGQRHKMHEAYGVLGRFGGTVRPSSSRSALSFSFIPGIGLSRSSTMHVFGSSLRFSFSDARASAPSRRYRPPGFE